MSHLSCGWTFSGACKLQLQYTSKEAKFVAIKGPNPERPELVKLERCNCIANVVAVTIHEEFRVTIRIFPIQMKWGFFSLIN